MDFKLLVEELLLELSADEIYDKFYKDIDYGIFYQISMADPKTKEQNGKIVFLGKYAKILLDLYKRKQLDTEDLPNAKEYLNHIYDHNIPVNTSQIKGIPDLYELVKKYMVMKTPSLSEILKALDKSEYQVLFDGNDWIIFKPLTEKASCYLGVQSVWCTTWGPQSLNKDYKDRSNQFEYYSGKDTLYILVNKKDNNLKYQFNFAAKQFMDLQNRQIGVENFLSANEEIKNFFFPSLVKDVSMSDIELQRKRMFALPSKDKQELLMIFLGKTGTQNELVNALINNEEETFKSLVVDEVITDFRIDDDYIALDLTDIDSDVEEIERTYSYYENESQNPYEQLSNEIYDRFDFKYDDWIKDAFTEILKKYYEKNKQKIIEQTGYRDFEGFKNRYYEDFYENEKIRDSFREFAIESAIDSYRIIVDERKKEISDYIEFEFYRKDYHVKLIKAPFLDYLVSNNITQITEINDVIRDYLESNNVPTEYEGVYDYDTNTPTYDDNIKNSDFVSKVDNHFYDIFGTDDVTQECVNARKKLEEIITKVFKGSREFENDEIKIQLNSPYVDCTDYTVDMTYKNKNTGKLSRGKVKVDNITKYVTNYALFENYISFKKLIK